MGCISEMANLPTIIIGNAVGCIGGDVCTSTSYVCDPSLGVVCTDAANICDSSLGVICAASTSICDPSLGACCPVNHLNDAGTCRAPMLTDIDPNCGVGTVVNQDGKSCSTTHVPTLNPTTLSPTTSEPTTTAPTTSTPTLDPTTSSPTTSEPTTSAPTTATPTLSPTTAIPTTLSPTTLEPTTTAPTTLNPISSPTPEPTCLPQQFILISCEGGAVGFPKTIQPGQTVQVDCAGCSSEKCKIRFVDI